MKTGLSLIASLQGHGSQPGQLKGALQGGNIAWIGKTVKQAKKDWRLLKRAALGAWTDKSEVDRELILPGGGQVTIWSAEEPDNIRGDGLDGVILNEGAFFKGGEYLWHAVLRPALMDTGGWAIFATTPNGFNWLKDLFDAAPRTHDWGRWQEPTWTNPLIPISEIEEVRRNTPVLTFRQEYGAEFVQQEGVEWPGEYFAEHIWYEHDSEVPRDVQCCVIAVDSSKGKSDKSDYSAWVVVRLDASGIAWIDPYIERCDVTQIAGKSVSLCRQNNPHGIGFEINSFQELIATEFTRQCHHASVDVMQYGITNTANKLARIRTLGPWLANRRVRVKRGVGGVLLVEQLRGFPLPEFHDDGPDAMEMGLRLASQMCSDRKLRV